MLSLKKLTKQQIHKWNDKIMLKYNKNFKVEGRSENLK